MFSCSCGGEFGSQEALDQHQAANGRVGDAVFTCRASRTSHKSWMWKNVINREAIHIIDSTRLEATPTSVSSTPPCELLCCYNWQNCKEATIQVPGLAPVWQDVPLPVTLPQDKGIYFMDQNAARIPQHSFEPLFRAVATMNREFRFDDVDIVVNRNSLRKLLDFCAERSQESFRVNLFLIHDTLIIERCERNTREFIRGSQAGWGHIFEWTFTRYPPGMEDSTGHHRALHYPLGDLNCVVRLEVDACYQTTSEERDEGVANQTMNDVNPKSTTIKMGKLSISSPKKGKAIRQTPVASQSTAAEIKAVTKYKSPSSYLPQLWFGRTPWLIMGCHASGTFNEVKVSNVAAHFAKWETNHQTDLRKLTALLAQFREIVKNKGGNCIAIYERGLTPRTIKVFASASDRRPLPNDLISTLWTA